MLSHERRHSMVAVHAWETWTKSGLGLDEDMRTAKTVRDAVNNTWVDGISDGDWLAGHPQVFESLTW